MESLNPIPRMPYGMAKRIVAAMQIGDACTVRPEWVVSLHNAARRMGLRLASVTVNRRGVRLVRMIRIMEGWPTGHAVARIPRRERISGRWRKDAA